MMRDLLADRRSRSLSRLLSSGFMMFYAVSAPAAAVRHRD